MLVKTIAKQNPEWKEEKFNATGYIMHRLGRLASLRAGNDLGV